MDKKVKFYLDGVLQEAEICGHVGQSYSDKKEYIVGGNFDNEKCYLISELKELYEIEDFKNEVAKKYFDFIVIDEECII